MGDPCSPGITFSFTASPPPDFPGTIVGQQVIERAVTTVPASTLGTNGATEDSCVYYEPPTAAGVQWSAIDAPGIGLNGYSSVSLTDNFTMYLMFKPTDSRNTSIYVPQREVTWGWAASAKAAPSPGPTAAPSWAFDTRPKPSATAAASVATDFPLWNNAIYNPGTDCPTSSLQTLRKLFSNDWSAYRITLLELPR